ncbi:MAG TPA: hypothetical protein VF592_05805 [Sphingomonas sp.]|jgi:hypothetical protein|uniref:hypothetical protein n=1 Tax=Sphingomonas sp. TaxID=28214 RepID=UPI002ED8F982
MNAATLFIADAPTVALDGVAIITAHSGDQPVQLAMTRHTFEVMLELFRRAVVTAHLADVVPLKKPTKTPSKEAQA